MLHRSDLAPQGTRGLVQRHFWLSQLGGGGEVLAGVETRDTANIL